MEDISEKEVWVIDGIFSGKSEGICKGKIVNISGEWFLIGTKERGEKNYCFHDPIKVRFKGDNICDTFGRKTVFEIQDMEGACEEARGKADRMTKYYTERLEELKNKNIDIWDGNEICKEIDKNLYDTEKAKMIIFRKSQGEGFEAIIVYDIDGNKKKYDWEYYDECNPHTDDLWINYHFDVDSYLRNNGF